MKPLSMLIGKRTRIYFLASPLMDGYLLAMSDVTGILSQIEHGDSKAAEQLLPLVNNQLRNLAAANLAQEKPGQTLQAMALERGRSRCVAS